MYQNNQSATMIELSDEALEKVMGGDGNGGDQCGCGDNGGQWGGGDNGGQWGGNGGGQCGCGGNSAVLGLPGLGLLGGLGLPLGL